MTCQTIKTIETEVLHFYQDSEQPDGGKTVYCGVKYDAFLGQCVERQYGQQHKSHLCDARIGQHPLYALLEYCRYISNKQRCCRNDGDKYLPVAFHVFKCIVEQSDKCLSLIHISEPT